MNKSDEYWLNVGYVVFFCLLMFVGYKAIELIGIQLVLTERYEWYTIAQTLGGVLFGGALTWYIRRDEAKKEYYLNSISELRKVTWPVWSDVKRMTMIVCVVVAVFAVILAVFDIMWSKALNILLT